MGVARSMLPGVPTGVPIEPMGLLDTEPIGPKLS